jgi:serine/threonine protein kinase/Tol biopolymer transport system component
MPLCSGTQLGPYEVLSLLGAGGMGEVYRARDSQLARDVAIKVLANLTFDPERLRRFEQEARAAAALNHPNILAVYQLGTHNGVPYLVSELLDGETLREQIKRSRLPVRKAIDYGAQIARGLAAAHEKGIAHRDLKPDNLLVTRDGRLKILDFGLAKFFEPRDSSQFGLSTLTSGTDPGTVLGTVGYMSPEQVRGDRVDHRTDIFAFGAILYEMLTGNRAFQKSTSAETMAAILNEDPPAISQVMPSAPLPLQRVVHRCLEKKPEARFQSASDLAFALEALSDSGVMSGTGSAPLQNSRTRVGWIVGPSIVLVASALIAWWMRPASMPVVEDVRQLTNDGNLKATFSTIVSDGSRVYFDEMDSGDPVSMQVSATGGQATPVPTTLRTSGGTAGLTPDNSALMMFGTSTTAGLGLWLQPLPTGELRRLGELTADDAGFFPDGRIVLSNGPALYVAEKDGSNPRKIVDLAGSGGWPRVSPDGKRIRFTIQGDDLTSSVWEIAANGAGPHQLLKGWHDPPNECCGKWTRDGKYFVFQYLNEGRWDLWALQERSDWFHRTTQQPVRLTNGPLSYTLPCPSRDSEQLFAVGSKRRGELVRYDAKTRQYIPYAGGPSAIDARVSPDGKWVVYLSYPDHTLWRSRPDGTERMQLTYPPMVVLYPSISPDGTKIAFGGFRRATRNLSLYIINIEGGVPEEITGAGGMAWSPDGKSIAFTAPAPGKHQAEKDFLQDYVVDLHTKKVSAVPDSVGLSQPFWPEANTLLALQMGSHKVMAFDFKTQRWSEFTHTGFGLWAPSPDGKYLYSDQATNASSGARVMRLRLADRKMETVLDLKGLRRVEDEQFAAGLNVPTWVSVTPDGSVLVTRDVGTQEIYALSVKWP